MILRYNLITLLFFSILTGCNDNETSLVPDDEAIVIRRILRENGIKIDDDELVDSYLEFISSSPHVDDKDRYWIIIPADGKNELFLTEDINELHSSLMFKGIITPSVADHQNNDNKKWVDTIVINTDTIIDVRVLALYDNKLRTLPPGIKYLRARVFNCEDNYITHLPDEIMEFTTPPFLYDTVTFYIKDNKIDTLNISDTLDNWLKKHAGEYWKSGQHPDSSSG